MVMAEGEVGQPLRALEVGLHKQSRRRSSRRRRIVQTGNATGRMRAADIADVRNVRMRVVREAGQCGLLAERRRGQRKRSAQREK